MHRLTAFRAVAVLGSFSRAAIKIGRTQPAVSQAIKSLEEEFNEPLFLRLGRNAKLTPAGEILNSHVEDAFDSLAQARARLQAARELKHGTLMIATSDTSACYLLPPVLTAFRRMYPGIEVTISNRVSAVAAEQVAAREADIGLVTLPISNPLVKEEPLVRREDVAICAALHPLSHQKHAKLKDLVQYPLLLLDSCSNTRAFIDRLLAQTRQPPRVSMELGSIEVIKRLVELDFGISIVPRIAVAEELKRGTLCAMSVLRKDQCRMLGVVTRKKGEPSSAAAAFAKMLREWVGTREML